MNTYAPVQKRQHESTVSPLGGTHKQRPVTNVGLPLFMQADPTASAAGTTLQRQCACASTSSADEECETCNSSKPLQTQLSIGASDDPLELEADQVAEQVLAAPAPAEAGSAPMRIQRFTGSPRRESSAAPDSVDRVLAGSGRPLEPGLQQDMQQRFGHDFSQVRVHTHGAAEQSARDVNANAYTVGYDIVFGEGRYAPQTREGQRLIAHELTHVVQQTHTTQEGASLQREEGKRPPSTGPACAVNPDCPATFCQPLPMSQWEQCANDIPFNLAGIALMVNSRVVSLWHDYMAGGTSVQDLSSRFGADFTSSATTSDTTDFLIGELRASLIASPPTLVPGITFIDLASRIGPAIANIGKAGNAHEMNFDVIGEIPGNIAGGIGSDQTSCPVGATPSTQNDERNASGMAHLFRDASGGVQVLPFITYTVRDTIDLCPGNCGSGEGLISEQTATVPMSRCEASGIYGDVPFVVNFAAPLRPFSFTP